jgi:hypothetical protein
MVLAAQVLELPRGAKLTARTSDISRTGCYIDTLNPSPVGSKVRLRLTHHDDVFEAVGSVVYTSTSLGMGIAFTEITPDELAKLDRWLANPEGEY